MTRVLGKSIRRPASLLCLLIALPWLGSPVSAEKSPAPGWVTLPLAATDAPVSVTVLDRELVTVTDSTGGFRFVSLPAGSYTAFGRLAGFETPEVHFRLRGALTAQVDLVLTPLIEEVITVTSEAPLLDERQLGKLVRDRELEEEDQATDVAGSQALDELRQGLVGGVKPLAITIPESGKLIFLAGALPPRSVAVELEVKNR